MLQQVDKAPQNGCRAGSNGLVARLLAELQRLLSQAEYAHLCALISESWPASKVMPLAHILVIDLKTEPEASWHLTDLSKAKPCTCIATQNAPPFRGGPLSVCYPIKGCSSLCLGRAAIQWLYGASSGEATLHLEAHAIGAFASLYWSRARH